jgi:peroxiredoxin
MKKILIAGLLLMTEFYAVAQQGYTIEFNINGLKDTTVYLGHFYGESTYVKDTARVNSKGEFTFDGNKQLPAGIYFLVMNKTRVFDFVVNKDQKFKITTDASAYVPKAKVEGDIDNELFFQNLHYNMGRNEEASPFVKVMQDSLASEERKKAARNELQKINEKVMAFQRSIIEKHPDAVVSKIFKANMPLQVPDAPQGAEDSDYALKFYREHYWDNLDLADETMLRLSEPLYRKKVEDYLDRLFMQHPDTLTEAINRLAQIAKENEETYKYFVWTVTMKYQQPEIMGLDEVFVNIYDTYFASGEMDFWANSSLKKNLKEQADKYRLSLIGKKAPNMTMLDENEQPKSLHDINSKYTIIYFFDPDCGFCKKETPVLKKYYDKTPLDVEVFAVSADTSMSKMRNYIKDMGMNWITVNGPRTYTRPYQEMYDAASTPTIFILDEDKKIIAKKLPAGRIEEFINNYERRNKSPN